MVAPGAQVISMRVLDAEGEGDGYVIAEAIYDAVQMGAKVVNLSLGTTQKLESKVLNDMVKWARTKGTLTTAAAGNDGTEAQHWPAAQAEVVSVAALNQANNGLAWYSTRGGWVDVAAIGTNLDQPDARRRLRRLVRHLDGHSGRRRRACALIAAADPKLGRGTYRRDHAVHLPKARRGARSTTAGSTSSAASSERSDKRGN